MNTETDSTIQPSQFLQEVFSSRKARNSAYSLSAYARDLGVSLSILSRVLGGKRPVSLKLGLQVSTVMDLDPQTHQKLMTSILKTLPKTAKVPVKLRRQLEHKNATVAAPAEEITPEHFQAISNWHHFAILNLLRLETFENSAEYVSKTLGISLEESTAALDRLVQLEFLETIDGKLKRTSKSFFVKAKNSQAGIRTFHSQMISKALENLALTDAANFRRRSITGVTLACSQSQLEILKEKIERFQEELLSYLEKDDAKPDAIYQMNIQFFPLTKPVLKEDL